MDIIATHLRALQFLAHRAHNEVVGPQFLQDHEFLGELYPAYESEYDDVVERCIGLGKEKIDLAKVGVDAAKMASIKPFEKSARVFFHIILKGEKDLCKFISESVPKQTDGTQNLLQGIADNSEKRQYKLQQRLAQS